MSWLTVSFETAADDSEALTDALMDAGALSVDMSDAAAGTPQEEPVFGEPGSAAEQTWERGLVTALFPLDADLPAAMERASQAAGLVRLPPYRVERLDDKDWVRATQSQFVPLQITRRMWIVPSWHAAPDPHAVNIVLDPGLAFGTGAHPTTRLCLRWLAAQLRGGESVIDFGCGSGILAIAALKLGAAEATGVDVDEQALLAARANAVQNQADIQFHNASNRLREPAQIVIANILANPLQVLAPLLAELTKPCGRVVLSGILAGQADEVNAAYLPWFDMDTSEHDEGWVLLSGVRKQVPA